MWRVKDVERGRLMPWFRPVSKAPLFDWEWRGCMPCLLFFWGETPWALNCKQNLQMLSLSKSWKSDRLLGVWTPESTRCSMWIRADCLLQRSSWQNPNARCQKACRLESSQYDHLRSTVKAYLLLVAPKKAGPVRSFGPSRSINEQPASSETMVDSCKKRPLLR